MLQNQISKALLGDVFLFAVSKHRIPVKRSSPRWLSMWDRLCFVPKKASFIEILKVHIEL